uniref:Uncharacterized protein n=1 Tax=Nelumbo nucifera TaxID=4432 RepID=A0A822XVH1_NELNU|nr:TPA_asm: hypothetical protein HUJ06_024429 [Nelumbo nucifera]
MKKRQQPSLEELNYLICWVLIRYDRIAYFITSPLPSASIFTAEPLFVF